MVRQVVFNPEKLSIPITVTFFLFNVLIFIWDFVHNLCHKLYGSKCAQRKSFDLPQESSSINFIKSDLAKNLRILPLEYWLYTLPYSPNTPYSYSLSEFCLEFLSVTFFMAVFLNLCKLHISQTYEQKLSQLKLLRKLVSDS